MNVAEIITKLGGTSEVARICEIKPPSVSEWKANNAIPKPWEKYLRLRFPEAFPVAAKRARKGRKNGTR